MNTNKIHLLADFLESLPIRKWDFEIIADSDMDGKCNSAGCAMGWMPSIFDECQIIKCNLVALKTKAIGYKAAAQVLDINVDMAELLFNPSYYKKECKTTPTEVASRLRQLANNQLDIEAIYKIN